MDLRGVRTFAAVAEAGQFQAAADELGITQQAVSKRIAALERSLGVALFVRSPRGTRLSPAGEAFLPHAHELLGAESRALGAIRPERRALRIDVLNRRTAPATALHAFHRGRPDLELDVVTLPDADAETALAAVLDGSIDATFRALTGSGALLPEALRAERVIEDRHQLLVGPRHPLADAAGVTLADLRAHPVWMPGMRADTEWGAYYAALSEAFGIRIDTEGPSFGSEALLDALAASAELAIFVGEGSRYLWPESYGLRRIPIVDPTPVYPHSIVWRADSEHPALLGFLAHLREAREAVPPARTWMPTRSGDARRGPGADESA